MSQGEDNRVQVPRGWISVWRRLDGVWGVSWEPHGGDPDYPGTTFTGTDELRPSDFPAEYDRERLLEWARRRWGGPRPT